MEMEIEMLSTQKGKGVGYARVHRGQEEYMSFLHPTFRKFEKNANYSTVFLLKFGQESCGVGKAVENIQVIATARSRVAVKRGALHGWLYPPQRSATSGGGCMLFLLHRGEQTLMKFFFLCTSPKEPPRGFHPDTSSFFF